MSSIIDQFQTDSSTSSTKTASSSLTSKSRSSMRTLDTNIPGVSGAMSSTANASAGYNSCSSDTGFFPPGNSTIRLGAVTTGFVAAGPAGPLDFGLAIGKLFTSPVNVGVPSAQVDKINNKLQYSLHSLHATWRILIWLYTLKYEIYARCKLAMEQGRGAVPQSRAWTCPKSVTNFGAQKSSIATGSKGGDTHCNTSLPHLNDSWQSYKSNKF